MADELLLEAAVLRCQRACIIDEAPPWEISDESVVTRAKPRHSCKMDSFRGDIASLKDALLPLDLDGEWEDKPNGVWRFRCNNKPV
jgi:hypothetical protein